MEEQLTQSAQSKFGLISRAEAIKAGLRSEDIRYRIATGRWQRVRRNVYRVSGAPVTWEQELLAAQMSLGGTAVVSHRSAAALWDLPGFDRGPLELTVRKSRNGATSEGVVIHRFKDLIPADQRSLRPFRLTNPCRTVIDLAGVCTWDLVEDALDDCLRRRILTIGQLRSRLDGLGRRPGLGTLRVALETRCGSTPNESLLEDRFLRLVRASGLPMPRSQFRIHCAGRPMARVDFAYPERKVAIECDGFRYHFQPRKWEVDIRRARALAAEGWTIYRFTWSDVVNRPAETAAELKRALAPGRRPSVSPNCE